MIYFLYGLHFIVCIAIIVVVLLQADKGSGLSGAFGGGGSYAKFGDEGGFDFMGKATTVVAVLFMVLSLYISIHTKNNYNAKKNAAGVSQEKPSDAMQKALQETVVETQKKPVKAPVGEDVAEPVNAPVNEPVNAPVPEKKTGTE